MITYTDSQVETIAHQRKRIESIAAGTKSESVLVVLRQAWKDVPFNVVAGLEIVPSDIRTSAKPAEIECGIYRNDKGIFKVRPSRKGAYNIAFKLSIIEVEVWNEDKGEYETKEKGKFDFAGASARFVKADERLTKEDALEFGQTHCFCLNCGKMLTADLSMERAIGPVCIKKF